MTGGGANEFIFGAPGRNSVTDFGAGHGNELVFSDSGFHLGSTTRTATGSGS